MSTALVLARMQTLPETVGQAWSTKNFRKKQKRATRIFVLRDGQEAAAKLRISGKLLRTGVQPGIDLGVHGTEGGLEFRCVALRIVHQKTRINTEETREQRARAVREM